MIHQSSALVLQKTFRQWIHLLFFFILIFVEYEYNAKKD